MPYIQCILPTGILEATRAWRLLRAALLSAWNAVLESSRLIESLGNVLSSAEDTMGPSRTQRI